MLVASLVVSLQKSAVTLHCINTQRSTFQLNLLTKCVDNQAGIILLFEYFCNSIYITQRRQHFTCNDFSPVSQQPHCYHCIPTVLVICGHIMRCGTIGSCQSAATSEIVKRCWSRVLTHVSGAIASVQTFTFTFT